MSIDASIALQGKLPQFDNPLTQYAQVAAIQQAQQQNRLAELTYGDKQRETEQTNALNNIYKGAVGADGAIDRNKLYTGAASGGLGSKIPGLQKGFAETDKAVADLAQSKSKTAETDGNLAEKRREAIGSTLGAIAQIPGATPQHVATGIQHLVDIGTLAPEMGQKIIAGIPQDPTQLQGWLIQGRDAVIKGADQKKYTTVDANTAAHNATTLATTGMNNATSVKTTGMNNQTSRANNADTIASSQVINGIGADGAPAGDVESMAKAISEGKLPPLSGFAIAKPRGQAIMARVMELNPTYDGGDYAAKNNALKGFSTGKEGTALRSFNVATAHLDTLSTMTTALDNGDVQFLNKAKNAWKEQFGGTAPTNFDAVKEIVGKEVVKAIVAGGGGVSEREELSNLLGKAKSPEQLQGVITHFKELMAAQKEGLMDQYKRTTGRDDGETMFAPSKKPAPANTLVDTAGKTNAVSKAAIKSGDPSSYAPKPGTVEGGFRFKGGNPTDARAWEKV